MARKILLLLAATIYLFGQCSANDANDETARTGSKPTPRFISVEPNEGNVEVNLDLSVPFITFPLDRKRSPPGSPMSLLNVNPKGLAIFGTLLVITAVVVPLFSKTGPEDPTEAVPSYYHHHHYGKEHKRRDRGLDFWNFDESLNDILSRNGPVTPCIQRVVCSAVATASRADNQSSVDKIIDGLSSNKWFVQATNGTSIDEAIAMGRKVLEMEECSATYKNCSVNQQILSNLLKIIGI